MKKTSILMIFILFLLAINLFTGCTKNSNSKLDKIMEADKTFKFPPGFPPDPGEEGKKTLEGIDSDGDGLRDDLQRWIYARYPNDPKKRAALKQNAIGYQKTLFLKQNIEEMKEELRRGDKASRCLYDTFPIDEAYLEGEYVQAKALNTEERIKRHLEVDRWFDGMTIVSSYPKDGTACEN